MQRGLRFQEILEILDKEHYISAEELSKRMYISLSTTYRDLREMEKDHLIVRSEGSVKRNIWERVPKPFDLRENENLKDKITIAKTASRLIQPSTTIFIDASTTVAQIVPYIETTDNITVVTNALFTADKLRRKGIHTYFLGGNLMKHSSAVSGIFGEYDLHNYNIEQFFFSAYGVNGNGVVTTSFEEEARLLSRLFKDEVPGVFLCDNSKFGRSAGYKIVDYSEIDIAVHTCPAPEGIGMSKRTILAE